MTGIGHEVIIQRVGLSLSVWIDTAANIRRFRIAMKEGQLGLLMAGVAAG